MSEDLDVVLGSGNIFADFQNDDAEAKQLKGQIAAEIIKTLNEKGLTVRAAAKVALADPSDIQRIRNADLSRFTLDRLVRIANRLGRRVALTITPIENAAA